MATELETFPLEEINSFFLDVIFSYQSFRSYTFIKPTNQPTTHKTYEMKEHNGLILIAYQKHSHKTSALTRKHSIKKNKNTHTHTKPERIDK